jgi:hypothetical protein
MQSMETETRRGRIPARPRVNTTESGDYESWHRRALIRYADIVRLVGEEPADEPCERWGRVSSCSRRPCDPCYTRGEWEGEILSIVRDATANPGADPANGEGCSGWGLYGSGYGVEGCPGRPYADNPHVYRHKRHPGVVVVSWSGGLDI